MTAAARTVLHWRLRALPYTYTVHHTAHATGCPIARPLFFAFPADGDSRAASTQVHTRRAAVHAKRPEPKRRCAGGSALRRLEWEICCHFFRAH